MRQIWEVVGDVELVHCIGNVNFTRWDGDKAWRRLALVMDMTEDELNRDIEEEIKKIEAAQKMRKVRDNTRNKDNT